MDPPSGTVALLFTDIEGSTALAQRLGPAWGDVLGAHHELVTAAIAGHGGWIDSQEGDSFFAVFRGAQEAVAAAVAAQRALRARDWPEPVGPFLRVRMGIHVGLVERRAAGYVGLEIHRAARVTAAGGGGQILLTDSARALAGEAVQVEPLGLHRLKDFPAPEALYSAVFDGLRASSFPPLRTLVVRPTNLPSDDRLLLGRDAELDALACAFTAEGCRLVTLTGRGGAGKTRLGLAAATQLLDVHPGGVWWVPLACVEEEESILPALAGAMAAEDDGSRPLDAVIAERIGTTPTLVVLDNLEHLVAFGPELADLLSAAPGLRVLATSQAPLRLLEERVMPLASLDPASSRELFRRIAARVRPGAGELDDALVDDLCRRLDHLPLAIELAAARLAVLSPAQLRDRLEAPLTVLRGGERDRPERQRSLRATIEWTLGLLDPEPRELFRRLGTFAGSVELEDLEAVCGQDGLDVLGAVAALLDVSILQRREDGSGAVRFRLPQALRNVAGEELDADPDGERWHRTHAEHNLHVAWRAAATMACTASCYRRAEALDRDAVAALAWAWRHDTGLACALAGARAARLSDRGHAREAQELADRVLAHEDIPDRVRAVALVARAQGEFVLGNGSAAVERFGAARELLPPGDDLRIFAGMGVVYGASLQTDIDWRATDEATVAEARALGSPHALAGALVMRAQAAVRDADFTTATAALREAVPLAAASDAKIAWHIDTVQADLSLAMGEPEMAARAYVRSMTAAAARGDALQLYLDLHGLAAALAAGGRPDVGLEAFGMGVAAGEQIGRDVGVLADDPLLGGALEEARAALGPAASQAAIACGYAIPALRRVEHARRLTTRLSAVAG